MLPIIATLLFVVLTVVSPIVAAQTTPQTTTTTIPNAEQVLTNIAAQIPALTSLLAAIVIILGIVFIVAGLIKLKHAGEQRSMMAQHGVMGPFLYLLVGSLLLFLPSTIQVTTSTFWSTPCSYCYPTSAGSPFTSFFQVVYAVVNFVGLIAFVRGLVILSHLGEQSQHGKLAQALTHIIGGIICINIGSFVQMIFATLGLNS